MRRAAKRCLWILLLLAVLLVAATIIALIQGERESDARPSYVAMGSSFAAGAGLGPLQEGSPWLCARSTNGYAPRLARQLRLSMVDRGCGGATAEHVLNGGQFFQPPQVASITGQTRLVTLTVGGNDIGYIGDLSMLAARRSGSLFGNAVGGLWSGPSANRDWGKLQANLEAIIRAAHRQAPSATVVVLTYPTILPQTGTCPALSLSAGEAATMRAVGDRLAAITAAAASKQGAVLVDMHRLGEAHHACSADPWTYGWTNAGAAPFHPTNAGAAATATAIASALKAHQQL